MLGSLKGILVGLANAVIVAFCIAMWIADGDVAEATLIITMVGALPATLTGAFLGFLAENNQHTNRRVMFVWMLAASCTAVAFLGTIFDLPELIVVSCVPTAAGCSILERWTRAKPEEQFPAARVA
ncbi:MAG: hypothetical protein M4D80_02900 [Myxococcota bacterium]|nr:hypothetical protein [Deltaproteobacteria bacterium]MDQ3334083.1 hypothetical protein [Myxococcota bacterium]